MTSLADPVEAQQLRVETVHHDDAAWVVFYGEADIATLEHLEEALARVVLDGTKSVHLHVADLDFADVATLRRLSVFVRQAKRAGHDVQTCGASPTLRKVARLMSLHDDLRL